MSIYICQLLHVLRPRRAEHQSLTIWTDLRNNLPDLRLKAHVKHAIGFVHHQVSDTPKIRLLCFKHVDKTTRSRDYDLYSTLQITNLRSLRSTSVDGSVTDTRTRPTTIFIFEPNAPIIALLTQTLYIPVEFALQVHEWEPIQGRWGHRQGPTKVDYMDQRRSTTR